MSPTTSPAISPTTPSTHIHIITQLIDLIFSWFWVSRLVSLDYVARSHGNVLAMVVIDPGARYRSTPGPNATPNGFEHGIGNPGICQPQRKVSTIPVLVGLLAVITHASTCPGLPLSLVLTTSMKISRQRLWFVPLPIRTGCPAETLVKDTRST